mmetsp:Transcript_16340/g.30504  ORF Transcript_16340/g.30504 Transcript_16340/m.30504 type:complete len:266 (-) Transcript_16340:662-1459(-)
MSVNNIGLKRHHELVGHLHLRLHQIKKKCEGWESGHGGRVGLLEGNDIHERRALRRAGQRQAPKDGLHHSVHNAGHECNGPPSHFKHLRCILFSVLHVQCVHVFTSILPQLTDSQQQSFFLTLLVSQALQAREHCIVFRSITALCNISQRLACHLQLVRRSPPFLQRRTNFFRSRCEAVPAHDRALGSQVQHLVVRGLSAHGRRLRVKRVRSYNGYFGPLFIRELRVVEVLEAGLVGVSFTDLTILQPSVQQLHHKSRVAHDNKP